MAYTNPTTRSDGYVVDANEWNKNTVDNPAALRSGAIAIASQAANDLIYASGASQFARLAAGTAGQVLQTNGAGSAPSWINPALALAVCGGRLTLTTGTPVTTSDVTAATTLYYALHVGNQIALYNGSLWEAFSIAELSIAVPATTNQMYDVFVDYNSGTPALALTAWTNDTTRATALTKQDGVYVLTGTLGKRYVGSFRTTGVSGQTEDSLAKRYVWNYYNRVARPLSKFDATSSWNYGTASWQQANASAANQIDLVVGVAEDAIDVSVTGRGQNSSGGEFISAAGIDKDAATAPEATSTYGIQNPAASTPVVFVATMRDIPAAGRHFYAWIEIGSTTGTTSFFGASGTSWRSGITGMWRG